MVFKILQMFGSDAKDDGSVSSEASLSSASAHTIEDEEPGDTRRGESFAQQVEGPPSYEHAISVSDSQHTSPPAEPSLPADSSALPPSSVLQTDHAEPTSSTDFFWTSTSKAKVHKGDQTLLSAETITGSVVVTGDLTILSTVRFIGSLEVQKSLRVLGSLTVDGPLRVSKAVNVHNKLNVSETADIGGDLNNHNRAVFAKRVTHHSGVSNYGTLTYNGPVNFCMAAIKNYGTINAEHEVSNAGKVKNLGKLNGLSSL
nr:hypothetical protein CFP56_59620 [Quercus suber]